MADKTDIRVQPDALKDFCVRALRQMDVPEDDARITANVLVAADFRGISSHGVARLRRYVNGLRDGVMVARPKTKVVTETPTTLLIDADGGLGQPVSHQAMEKAIQKAEEYGVGFASTVPRGKLEVYRRLGKSIPLGWATDETGEPTNETGRVLDNLKERAGGGLLPLGGAGELLGGHKGYGLTLLVDILSGVLPGAAYANLVYPKDEEGKPLPSAIGHFLGAWRVDAFRPVDEFKAAMDDLQRRLKNAPKAEGQDRIYVHGEKEYEEAERNSREGVPLNPKVAADLRAIGDELDVAYDLE